jgi:regulator of protease activity HflC (stomatin/prohibitin superfamily)
MSEAAAVGLGIIVIGGLVFGGIGGCMYVAPQYNVYSQRMDGQAAYQKAESDRQIKVLEAKAAFEAADMTSKAEVRRAEGVAEANKIIADGLGGPEGYLRWRYIEMLENTGQKNGRDVIYIPTEAGLPLLEAGRATVPTR